MLVARPAGRLVADEKSNFCEKAKFPAPGTTQTQPDFVGSKLVARDLVGSGLVVRDLAGFGVVVVRVPHEPNAD